MSLKEIRNKINKKIDENYKIRQKRIVKIKECLSIDFNKISNYGLEINIAYPNTQIKTKNNKGKEASLFKIEIPGSIISNARFYYKEKDIDYLSIKELANLENDLQYILAEIEKKIDEYLI